MFRQGIRAGGSALGQQQLVRRQLVDNRLHQKLRRRVIFTFALLAVYRVGSFVPVPGVDPGALSEFVKDLSGTASGSNGTRRSSGARRPGWRR